MSAELSREELAALSEAVAGMTPGPWDTWIEGERGAWGGSPLVRVPTTSGSTFIEVSDPENAAGIVALVNAAPALIALAERALDTEGGETRVEWGVEYQWGGWRHQAALFGKYENHEKAEAGLRQAQTMPARWPHARLVTRTVTYGPWRAVGDAE